MSQSQVSPEQREALAALTQFCVGRFLQGASDAQVEAELAQRFGMSADQTGPIVSGARQGFESGMGRGVRNAVAAGVGQAFGRFAAERAAQNPPRRLGIRVPCLALGIFLLLASLGGYAQGEIAPATVVLLVGGGLASLFFVLKPSARAAGAEARAVAE